MDIVALGPISTSTDSMAEELDPRAFMSLPASVGAGNIKRNVASEDPDVPELVVQLPSPTEEDSVRIAAGRDSPDRVGRQLAREL